MQIASGRARRKFHTSRKAFTKHLRTASRPTLRGPRWHPAAVIVWLASKRLQRGCRLSVACNSCRLNIGEFNVWRKPVAWATVAGALVILWTQVPAGGLAIAETKLCSLQQQLPPLQD
ncbi:hypothetical protein WJX74_007577 [Apatococcus lobatus]|uniref:Uncharacterized protein n=1 Tax=Apatococcus lobatus TaxID=904363 RepID=A0AAW1RWW9_9CHLO